jgi:CBS domain-containing protein
MAGGSKIVKKSWEDLGATGTAREISRVVRELIGRWPREAVATEPVLLGGAVRDVMTRSVATCSTVDTLQRAAQLMWDRDCGSIPVVDAEGCAVGVVTDRDLCMAGYTQGRALSTLAISGVLSGRVHACSPLDSVDQAVALMRTHRVRRLVVVDARQKVVGMLALADIARYVAKLTPTRPGAAFVLSALVVSLSERRPGALPADRAAE